MDSNDTTGGQGHRPDGSDGETEDSRKRRRLMVDEASTSAQHQLQPLMERLVDAVVELKDEVAALKDIVAHNPCCTAGAAGPLPTSSDSSSPSPPPPPSSMEAPQADKNWFDVLPIELLAHIADDVHTLSSLGAMSQTCRSLRAGVLLSKRWACIKKATDGVSDPISKWSLVMMMHECERCGPPPMQCQKGGNLAAHRTKLDNRSNARQPFTFLLQKCHCGCADSYECNMCEYKHMRPCSGCGKSVRDTCDASRCVGKGCPSTSCSPTCYDEIVEMCGDCGAAACRTCRSGVFPRCTRPTRQGACREKGCVKCPPGIGALRCPRCKWTFCATHRLSERNIKGRYTEVLCLNCEELFRDEESQSYDPQTIEEAYGCA